MYLLIIGAGPVGLSAALFLSFKGLIPKIIDKLPEPSKHSKALAINARTLDLFSKFGLAEEFVKNAYNLKGANIFKNEHKIAKLDLTSVNISHKYPFVVVQEQSESEKVMIELLKKRNIFVERGVGLAKIVNLEKQVEVELQNINNGHIIKSRFDYVFSADGAHSIVRKSLGLNFAGETYDETWSLYDARFNTKFNNCEFYIHMKDNYFIFLAPIKDNIWRIFSNNSAVLSHLPKGIQVLEILWESKFTISHRVIEKFNVGNVYFGGDSAHVHSPAGGRGMNLGIEDAFVFSELLEKNQLNNYNSVRQKAVNQTVKKINFLTNIIRGRSFFSRVFRYFARLIVPIIFPLLKKQIVIFFMGLDHDLYI